MEGMGEVLTTEGQMTSAAAFVEGGIQEACDDACSICLEAFCESDPSTVTSCKHEFHLQCILEWCQRSSNCPMCWQPIALKDPTSQELLEAVERERTVRANPTRNSTIFHHPTLGEFELQHLPMGMNSAELEDRIIQHLAAAAAMGRAHQIGRREGHRRRPHHSQYLVFSAHPDEPAPVPVSTPLAAVGTESAHRPLISPVQTDQDTVTSSGPSLTQANHRGAFVSNSISCVSNENGAGPSDSLSENWKSRLSSMSMKYKESISKSTRGWKERLFARSTSMSDIGSEVRREVNARIASVSRMMDRLETREDNREQVSISNNASNSSGTVHSGRNNVEAHHERPLNDNKSATVAASSDSN